MYEILLTCGHMLPEIRTSRIF